MIGNGRKKNVSINVYGHLKPLPKLQWVQTVKSAICVQISAIFVPITKRKYAFFWLLKPYYGQTTLVTYVFFSFKMFYMLRTYKYPKMVHLSMVIFF